MDLTPYIARGFPGDFDAAIAQVPVAGVDRDQSQGAVRLCAQTEHILYDGGYSPTEIRYRPGRRPQLEAIAGRLKIGAARADVCAAMKWVVDHVVHPQLVGPTPADRAMSEEQLIESGVGWCNEQARVFISLCEVMAIPARMCFAFHANGRASHAATELYLEGRWAFFDVTFNVCVELSDGRLAEGRELSGSWRHLAHAAYRPRLSEHYEHIQPFVETMPGWNQTDRPKQDHGGDLLDTLGICNYIIDGAEAVT